MIDSNIFKLNKPEQSDPLQEVLREDARRMLATAIEAQENEIIKSKDCRRRRCITYHRSECLKKELA